VTASQSDDDLIDRVAEQIMLGQDPDVEGLIAITPDMAAPTREKLRKLARAFAPAKIRADGAAGGMPRDRALPFTELGPYRVLSRMGEGGMGHVYLAEQKFLARRVALKVIRPELALSTVTRERFQREAMRIAKLRHENIVSVYDAGEHDGVAFLAMEVIEGPGLDELLQTARRGGQCMNVSTAVRHARDVARALQCAHAAGIIHRDVKPSNVRIALDGRALLLDFGLSLADAAPSLTSVGNFRGTPQYASPEQIETGSVEIDARTDVYSLGITLYECLTGEVPFASATMVQLFHQILASDPRAPREINGQVDDALSAIVMRAIAKRREDRFSDAGEMERALDDWLRTAERASAAPPDRRSFRRALVAVAGAMTLCAAAWFVLRSGANAPAAAGATTSPIVASTPRRTTALFGNADRAFDQRLIDWGGPIGGGTFGSDEDGHGVIGVSVDAISAAPYALPSGRGSVRGRVTPIALKPGEPTLGSGAAVEFANGRVVALMLVAAADGHALHVCELMRDRDDRLVRGPVLESFGITRRDDVPLALRLEWTDTDVRFDCRNSDASASAGSFSIPSSSHPSRLWILVEKGSARFEEWVLEET
jgi:tRNA A-37 threonylcarbamoyl transferase component Bud32